jgi:hypothetical protein
MLVSHEHKFIFIKTHKTAGSSIESWLMPYCREHGIIDTRRYNSHWPARAIKAKLGPVVWKDYTKICPIRNPWDQMVSLYFWRKRPRSLGFMTKRVLQGLHPYTLEQRLSFEAYLKKRGKHCNIDREKIFITSAWEDYFYIRFEHLHEDLQRLTEHLNLPDAKHALPEEKTGYRPDREYRKYYTEMSRDIVARAFDKEIEKWGYSF